MSKSSSSTHAGDVEAMDEGELKIASKRKYCFEKEEELSHKKIKPVPISQVRNGRFLHLFLVGSNG